MALKDRSTAYTGIGVSASGLGSLVSILAFSLPYWIYYDENSSITDTNNRIVQVHWTYHYGLWNVCNRVSSASLNSSRCSSVDTHSNAEQATVGLLVLSIILFVSSAVNAGLYLTIFKKQKICLYVSLVSVLVAGVLILAAIISFGRSDHSVKVPEELALTYTASNLYASFWLAVSGCILVVIAAAFISLAIFVQRNKDEVKEDEKSIVSYSSGSLPEKLKFPDAPAAISYYSSYSSSSESVDADDSQDSDDSEIDPAFAKLKTKLPQKTSETSDEVEQHRSKSAEPLLVVRSPSKTGSIVHSNRSVTSLTPVEQPDIQDGGDTKKTSSFGSVSSVLVETSVFVKISEINPLHSTDPTIPIELSRAPVATNLEINLPRATVEADEMILRRAKTEMPFTQKMKETIDKSQTQQRIQTEDANNVPANNPFVRKPPKLKRTTKKRAKEDAQRKKEITDTYNDVPTIMSYVPKAAKSAPWSKHYQMENSMKWSLKAYGIEVPSPVLKNQHRVNECSDHTDA